MLLMGSSSGTEFEDTRKSNKTANNSRLTNKRPVGGELRAEGHGGYIIQYSSNMTIVKYCLHITSMIQCMSGKPRSAISSESNKQHQTYRGIGLCVECSGNIEIWGRGII